MYLVAGLGNPGPSYVGTRHNAGFLVVDRLASRLQASFGSERQGACSVKTQLGTTPVVLVKPMRFMNLSGQPVATLANFYRVALDHVIVVHDELDLSFGDVRVKVGGGHAGHNGLRDMHKFLGAPGYVRVRVGISHPPAGRDVAGYVLSRFSPDEQAGLIDVVDRAVDAVEAVVQEGATSAMNRFNTRSADPRPNLM